MCRIQQIEGVFLPRRLIFPATIFPNLNILIGVDRPAPVTDKGDTSSFLGSPWLRSFPYFHNGT
jgi:hypothetical protein